MSRYFLGSFVNKEIRDYIRDLNRLLKGQQRSLDFNELERIYFSFKYLGENISEDSIKSISKSMREKFSHSFVVQLDGLSLGRKSQQKSNSITIQMQDSPEFNKLKRILHNLAVDDGGEDIYRKQDINTVVGIAKIASIRPSISRQDMEKVREIVENYEFPKEFLIDNFSIISTQLGYDHKKKVTLVDKINLV